MSNHPSRKAGQGTVSPSMEAALEKARAYIESRFIGTMHETGVAMLHTSQQDAFKKALSDVLSVFDGSDMMSLAEIGLPSNPAERRGGLQGYYILATKMTLTTEDIGRIDATCGGVRPVFEAFEYGRRFESAPMGLLVLPSGSSSRAAVIAILSKELAPLSPVSGYMDFEGAPCVVLSVQPDFEQACELARRARLGYRTVRYLSDEVSRLDEYAERKQSVVYDDGPSF